MRRKGWIACLWLGVVVMLQAGMKEQIQTYLPSNILPQNLSLFESSPEGNHTVDYYRELYRSQGRAVWSDIVEKLEEGLNLERRMEKAPEKAYFSADKASLRQEMDGIFDEIMSLLLDGELTEYRRKIREVEEEIASLRKEIARYREARIAAPSESMVRTTRSGYDRKIADAQRAIAAYRGELARLRAELGRNLQAAGIRLSPGQIDVLLSRIDGDDIVRMTMALEVLREISIQLSGIMEESRGDLANAKKYYGMYMVLVEMVAWVQQRLIEKYENEYLPKIDGILARTQAMIDRTRRLAAEENDAKRRSVYQANLRSLEYTLRVARRYRQDLQRKLRQMERAYQLTRKKAALAKNTYKTVVLSDELFGMMAESRKMFDEVMRLQIPEIVPFDSEIVKEKYLELTRQMRQE